jgi:hypothetical protein
LPEIKLRIVKLDHNKYIETLWENLPLYSEEGGEVTSCEIRSFFPDYKSDIDLLEEVFTSFDLLDSSLLEQGVWRFKSFPATLLAKSIISSTQHLLMSGVLSDYSYVCGNNSGGDELKQALSFFENYRQHYYPEEARATRFVHGVLPLIIIDNKLLLSNSVGTEFSNLDNHTLFSGRLSKQDLCEVGEKNALRTLQSPSASQNLKTIEGALKRTMQKATGLDLKGLNDDYTYSPCELIKPFKRVAVVGGYQALTEYYIHPFKMYLSKNALLKLNEKAKKDNNLYWLSIEMLGLGEFNNDNTSFLDAVNHYLLDQEACLEKFPRHIIELRKGYMGRTYKVGESFW